MAGYPTPPPTISPKNDDPYNGYRPSTTAAQDSYSQSYAEPVSPPYNAYIEPASSYQNPLVSLPPVPESPHRHSSPLISTNGPTYKPNYAPTSYAPTSILRPSSPPSKPNYAPTSYAATTIHQPSSPPQELNYRPTSPAHTAYEPASAYNKPNYAPTSYAPTTIYRPSSPAHELNYAPTSPSHTAYVPASTYRPASPTAFTTANTYRPTSPTYRPSSAQSRPQRKNTPPKPIYYSPTNPIPTPYSASRPKPRPGFIKRILLKIESWLRSFVRWLKKNPIKAGLLTFLPVLAGAGIARIFGSSLGSMGKKLGSKLGKGKLEVESLLEKKRKSASEAHKGNKKWGWGLDDFVGFNGSKGGPLDGILKIVQMWVNHLCRVNTSMVPKTASLLLELYFLEVKT